MPKPFWDVADRTTRRPSKLCVCRGALTTRHADNSGIGDEELARLSPQGASVVADHRTAEGLGWVVMTDPEGNEFCIERSDTERAGA
jgi:hypothetical protein